MHPLTDALPIPISLGLAITALFHSPILVSVAFSVFAAYLTRKVIPLAADTFIAAGQSGKDVQKVDKPVR